MGITLKFEDAEGIPDLDIDSVSWGAQHTPPDPSAGPRKAQNSDVSLSRATDQWSPVLARAVAQGRSFGKITIVFTKKDGSPTGSSALTVVLTDVMISSFRSGGNPPKDSFTLNFTKVEFNRDIPPGGID